jgi:L-ascorbate metabolism protein UlaG (beta-lactamase superfamily)
MQLSRRQFFKGLGVAAAVSGLGNLVSGKNAHADSTSLVGKGQIGIEWIGHGSFVFTSVKGKKILFDPWVSTNPKCPSKYKKKGGFGSADIILWTHGHVDHFMLPDAKKIIAEYNPKIIAPWELSFFIKSEIPKADTQTFALGNKGATSQFGELNITMTEAFHSSGAQLTGFEGSNRFVGEAAGYIIEFENKVKIYHSGDTSLMGDMKTIIGEFYKPDIAILPIGGVFTMGPKEAAYACSLIKPKIVIPEHFGTFPVLEQTTERFKTELNKIAPEVKMVELKPGIKNMV